MAWSLDNPLGGGKADAISTNVGDFMRGLGKVGHTVEGVPNDITKLANTVNPLTLISHLIGGGGSGHPQSTPNQPAPAAPASQPQQSQTLQSLLSAILGQQQGLVPQGYANFFTQVAGPMQSQLNDAFSKQLKDAMKVGAGVPGMSAADSAVVNKAMGSTLGDLMGMNQAATTQASPGAAEFGNFIGQMANTQKLLQSLQNALSFIPYSASGMGTLPPAAADVLSALGVQGLAGLGSPTAGTTSGSTPAKNPFGS